MPDPNDGSLSWDRIIESEVMRLKYDSTHLISFVGIVLATFLF